LVNFSEFSNAKPLTYITGYSTTGA